MKRQSVFIAAGCLGGLIVLGGAVAAIYLAVRTKELRAPLLLALPECKGGVYTRPSTQPADIFDDLGNDAAKRACEETRGLQGEALLSSNSLTLRIHNPSNAAIAIARVRLVLKAKNATSFQREYRFQGQVAPLSDGSLVTSTNLDPGTLDSFSASLTWVFFDP